jgi:hypothetical protein
VREGGASEREPRRRPDALAAIVTGLGVSVFLLAALASVAGRLLPAIGIAALLGGLASAAWLVSRQHGAGAPPSARLAWPEAASLAVFAAVSVRQFGWVVYERGGEWLTLLPHNFGDLPLHWTYIRHMADGASFWPANPVFASLPLRYPLGVDLLAAAMVQLGGTVPEVLRWSGLVASVLTALALRRWGGAFAVAGFLFAGGLAGLEFFATGQLRDYQSAVAWKNVYLTLFVPQRGFLLALPMGLLLMWSWRRRLLRDEPGLPPWVEGLLWGALPIVHLHTFAFVSVVAATWALAARRLRAALPALAVACLPATWGVWMVTDRFRAASVLGWKPGWMIGGEGPLVFLLLNFGVYVPLALWALARAVRERRREETLVLAPALAAFGLLFLVRVAPWEWDNTKVMVWCYLASLPPLQALLLDGWRPPARVAALVLLFFSGGLSVLAASVAGDDRLAVADRAEVEAVCAALAPLGRDEPVATAQVHNHPVALCGQPLVAGYSGHLWSHGIDSRSTEGALARLMNGAGDWRPQARALGARHLFWGPREQAAFRTSRQPWLQETPRASGAWGALYSVD